MTSVVLWLRVRFIQIVKRIWFLCLVVIYRNGIAVRFGNEQRKENGCGIDVRVNANVEVRVRFVKVIIVRECLHSILVLIRLAARHLAI